MRQNLLRFLPTSHLAHAEIINILIITAIWIVMVIIINPSGNFPLNDDWVYGLSVKYLIEKGDFQLIISSANLLTQVLWGALFCLPFGFSFNVLRFSNLVLGLVGVVAIYKLLKEVKVSPRMSLLGALLIAINPLYFELSNTFMTDIPFFAFTTLSVYFLIRGLRRDSIAEIFIGILLSYAAIMVRQLGLVIPLAFFMAYIIKKGFNVQNCIKGITPALLGFSIQFVYQKWLQSTMRLNEIHNLQAKSLLKTLSSSGLAEVFVSFTRHTFIAFLYLGLLIFPFIIILAAKKIQEFSSLQKTLTWGSLSFLSLVVTAGLVARNKLMPLSENILLDFGLGPVTLRDTHILKLPHLPTAPKLFWIIITAISVVGAALVLLYLFLALMQIVQSFKRRSNSEIGSETWILALVISATAIYFLPMGIVGFFDRYLLPLLPLLMVLVAVSTQNISNWNPDYRLMSISIVMMLLCLGFTLGATHDYLSWNRVRWQALSDLIQAEGISPNRIDGGYEFNGLYLFDIKYKPSPNKSWWWVDRDDYIVSFGPLPGYDEMKRYPFRRWVPFGQGNIFILQKTNKSSGVPVAPVAL